MKAIYKASLASTVLPLFLTACNVPPAPTQQGNTTPPVIIQRPIPEKDLVLERPARQKITPASYQQWLGQADNLKKVREYERFLEQNNVGHIVPSFELFRTARDWQRCGRSEYMVPSRELWQNQVETLKVFKYMVATKTLTDYEVTSVYRDLPLNQCAGGASSSRHLFNSAIDFRIGPQYPQPEDYAFIENTKYKLCQFWSQYGQRFNMGLGLYASGQIHIDTQGYRTWGPDLTRNSSMCSSFL
ncbi:peptidase M15 [Acinetobacter larvae]|uniref:Peptidase M15 n=1 Tax=Acinetobacter larvae TaxID=1789224 RepID=A0A1B2M074_9GAMM|nr:D-Ala-D-Ala carboxypeptidase family metallohydrolase [Acinetobacter larvae]AOA58596.1 peptidase M15 [Acinetobacter larvae]